MFDIIRIGKIHRIDYINGTASVIYNDRNNQPSPQLPFFSTMYEMPAIDDMVVVILLPNSSSKGFILGTPWHARKKPSLSGAGLFVKTFSDGAYIKYDSKTRKMEVSAENIIFDSVSAENVTVKGKLTAQSVETKQLSTKELSVETAQIKNLNVTGTATGQFTSSKEDV